VFIFSSQTDFLQILNSVSKPNFCTELKVNDCVTAAVGMKNT